MHSLFKKIKLVLFLFLSFQSFSQQIYDYKVSDIEGEPFDMNKLKGKKVMVVNTASKCGLTPQFEELEKLYKTYKDNNFIIIGFPTNDFLNQDPGSNDQIKAFCIKNYGVTFPMMSKISVKGKDKHPLYEYLTTKSLNKLEDNKVKWNFQKYLIDEKGVLVRVVDPSTSPLDDSIIQWIKQK
jgi:glutathione peroxidase